MSRNVLGEVIYTILFITLFSGTLMAINVTKDITIEEAYQKARSFRNKDSDSILFYTNIVITNSEKTNRPEYQAKALIFESQTNLKIGNIQKALIDSEKALFLINKYNLISQKKECLSVIGAVYQSGGYYDKALNYYFKAKNINVDSVNKYYYEADLDFYIGSLYIDLNKIEEGREYLKNSAAISLNHGNEKGAFKSLMLLSDTYNNIDSVFRYMGKCEEILNNNEGLSYEKVVFGNNKALISKALGNYTNSRKLYLDAIHICKENHFMDYLMSLYNNYAYLLMAVNDYDSAEVMLENALYLSKRKELLDEKANIFDSYSDLYLKKRNYKKAYLYKDSSDRVLKIVEKNKQIQQSLFLSTIFETVKKEKEILKQKDKNFTLWVYLLIAILILILLTIFLLYFGQKLQLNKARVISLKKDKKLDVANALIIGQDRERKRLAMDLHDGLGASLGTLRLTFDSELKNNGSYHELTNLIDEIMQSVRDMSHRMMPTRLDKIGLIPSLNNLAVSLTNTGKFTVHFKTNINKRLPDNLELNLYYLVYELVNNAIRHSNGNTIFVELIDHDVLISLSVTDNGTEFKSDEFSDGMGLKNVKARVEYLDGELNVDANGQETIFMVEIPIKR
ncbi:MAG: hypothetical protein GXO88_13505 [Chlorobi bacterium]|nr:hypothetical protein [Chlorobiota bacterium]